MRKYSDNSVPAILEKAVVRFHYSPVHFTRTYLFSPRRWRPRSRESTINYLALKERELNVTIDLLSKTRVKLEEERRKNSPTKGPNADALDNVEAERDQLLSRYEAFNQKISELDPHDETGVKIPSLWQTKYECLQEMLSTRQNELAALRSVPAPFAQRTGCVFLFYFDIEYPFMI